MNENYPIVLEEGAKSWGAFAPDLPGCVAVGDTAAETLRLMRGAIRMHVEAMAKEGLPIPAASARPRPERELSCEILMAASGFPRLLLGGFPMNWDSAFTWVDGELLSELGVAAERRRRLPLPSGGTAVRDVGYIRIRCGGKETVDEAVFAKKKDFSALGVRALLGLQIPPPAKFRRLSAARLSAAA